MIPLLVYAPTQNWHILAPCHARREGISAAKPSWIAVAPLPAESEPPSRNPTVRKIKGCNVKEYDDYSCLICDLLNLQKQFL